MQFIGLHKISLTSDDEYIDLIADNNHSLGIHANIHCFTVALKLIYKCQPFQFNQIV